MSPTRLFASALATASLLSFAAQAHAGMLSAGLDRYIEGKAGSEEIKVLVVMKDQASVGSLDQSLHERRAPMSERHPTIINALREAADRSQDDILRDLETMKAAGVVRGYTPYWLVNAIVVGTNIDGVRQLALRDDVDVIEVDLVVERIEPVGMELGQRGGIGITPGVVNIGARRVWEELGITGEGALVANMDTGVDLQHPALNARWRGNFAPASECWRDAIGFGDLVPEDHNGHGTHVMGTITGQAPGDTIGVCPGALWIADNTINQGVGSAFDNDVIAGYQWFADPDGNPNTLDDVPDVVQNSWRINEGFPGGYVDCDSRWWAVIDNAEAAGVVTTWSAGNEGPGGTTIGSPADRCTTPYNTFSVGATIHSPPFTIAGFSSRGPSGCGGPNSVKPEISAPGVSIYSSWPGGGYQLLDGTSMAGPHVAGVVGLMRSANPDLDVQTIKQILADTANDLGAIGNDNTYGHGFLDAYDAVLGALTGYGTIEGIVTASGTGQPIEGVAIDVLNDPRAVVTDEDGFFRIMLPAGTWQLEFSFFGYLTETLQFNVVAQQTTDGDNALVLAPQAQVSGVVRDFENNLVSGATITVLDTPLAPVFSGPNGQYSIFVPSGDTYSIRARKNGFGSDTDQVVVNGNVVHNFVLPELTGEDFETGDFASWPWIFDGNQPWTIDTAIKHEGLYSARSGVISNNQVSTMQVTLPVAVSGNISFWYNVSSEANFDLLRFYIDDVQQGQWSGTVPWTLATFPVTNGTHTFRWTYQKNSSGAAGSDAAWVDQIQFPNIGFPEVALSASSMSASLPPGGTTQQVLTLINSGDGTLNYIASAVGVEGIIPALVSSEGGKAALGAGELAPEGAAARSPSDPVLLGSGGPDGFGYRWVDSDDPDGPTYNWVEISQIGTGILMGDHTYSAPIGMNITFSFYGNNYSSVMISANGFLSFTAPPGQYGTNGSIPSPADPDNIIAPFWDDLNPNLGGTVHFYKDTTNQRFIVQWTNIPLAGSGGSIRETFQVILNIDGSIVTQYKSVQNPTSATVGIENSTGSDGLQVVFNAAYLHNNLAIRFATAPPVSWLEVSPTVGSVPPGGQGNLLVDYDATGLALGVYEAIIHLITNDPDESVIDVPVTLTVTTGTDVVTSGDLPKEFELAIPEPNPFSRTTSIRYAVPVEGRHVTISLFDVSGRLIRTLVNGPQAAGRFTATWNGLDEQGLRVTSGVYFSKMVAGGFQQVQKVTLLK
jgi:subtilisin family serine protease